MKLKLDPKRVPTLKAQRDGKGRLRSLCFDTEKSSPPGFGLRVSGEDEATRRTWILFDRTREGRQRLMTIGEVGILSLSDAREQARKILRKVAKGRDPVGEARAKGEGLTVAGLVKLYVEAAERGEHNPKRGKLAGKTLLSYKLLLRRLETGSFGGTLADVVSDVETRRFETSIAEGRGVTTANRMHALLSASFRWGHRSRLVRRDPIAGLGLPRKEEPRRPRLTEDEIKALWTRLDARDEAGARRVSVTVTAGVRLLLLLGLRVGELTRARWCDVRDHVLEIPAKHRKGGRALAVPLPRQAWRIFEELREVTGREELILAGARGGSLLANPDRWMTRVRDVTGVQFSAHACRRTFAQGLARLGVPSERISRHLGHSLPTGALAVTEGYVNYDFLSERRRDLQKWADHVETVVSGKQPPKVVPLARA